MPIFNYTAIDKEGRDIKGRLEAASAQEAMNMIREKGCYPTNIAEEKGKVDAAVAATVERRQSVSAGQAMTISIGGINQRQITLFTRQLATLLGSGLPLVRSLYILERQQKPGPLKTTIRGLAEQVEGGSSFSEALAKFPKTFPPLYVNTVKAGETGGVLEVVLARLADFAEKSQRITSKIRAALIYPAMVLTVATVVLFCLITFIVPRFMQIFKEMNVELPTMTKVLLFVSELLGRRWFIGLGIIVSVIVIYNVLRRLPLTKFLLDKLKLQLPVMGSLLRRLAIARFARTLGTLLSSGVPILQSLMVAKDTSGNEVIARVIIHVHDSVREGETVAKPLLKAAIFPAMAVNMISVGEETGQLDQMLLKIADVYDEEVDVTVSGLMSLLEPFLIIGMGLVVGFIVVSMFLPLFQLVTALGSGGG